MNIVFVILHEKMNFRSVRFFFSFLRVIIIYLKINRIESNEFQWTSIEQQKKKEDSSFTYSLPSSTFERLERKKCTLRYGVPSVSTVWCQRCYHRSLFLLTITS